MRNLVAKNNFNRAATHKSAKAYSRSWSIDEWDVEPPRAPSYKGFV